MIRGALERGEVDAAQRPVTGKNLAKRRRRSPRAIKEKDRPDRRRRRRPDLPAAELPRVRRQRRPDQGRRPGDDPGGRDAQRRRGLNSSITFNKKNFWIDPKSTTSISSASSTPRRTSRRSRRCSTSRSPGRPEGRSRSRSGHRQITNGRSSRPRSRTTTSSRPIDLTMGVEGRDLGHVADDISRDPRRVRRDTTADDKKRQPTLNWAPSPTGT